MKDNYLKELRDLLDNYKMEENEKDEIIADYNDMYEGYAGKGMADSDIVKKLGSPLGIIRDLTEGYKKVEKPVPGGEKFIALSPFITLIAFLILGFGFDLWHPGWVVFTLIPITAIIVEMGKTRDEQLTTALSPFFATLIYLYLGFYHGLWHPGWIVFIIIPILGIWNSRRTLKKLDLIVSLSPFATGIAYVFLGLNGYWTEGWVVFLLIPMLGILNEKNILKMLGWELLCLAGIASYLYFGSTTGEWGLSLLSFVPLVVYSIFTGHITIDIDGGDLGTEYQLIVVVSAVIFILLGWIFNLWGVAWLVFFAIPIYAIKKEAPAREHMVAISPFVATAIFFILGYFFGWWAYSWMAFLLIPMVAIVKNV